MNERDWSALQSRADPATIHVFAEDVAELWCLHPFREGNTRTTMNFVGQFAKEHGFPIDMELQKNNVDFVRNCLVMATDDQPEYIARILKDSRQRQIDADQSELKDNDASRGAAWVCSASKKAT